jgi:hypothetical protein
MTNAANWPIFIALRFAAFRALEVWWAGLLALAFWLTFITVGPVLESRWFPVETAFRVAEIAEPGPDVIAFRPAFSKVRDCSYLGLSWFAKDDKGQIERRQVQLASESLTPATGPVGARLGQWWEIGVKDKDREMFGIAHHSCGLPWETRSVLGPFRVSEGHNKTITRK